MQYLHTRHFYFSNIISDIGRLAESEAKSTQRISGQSIECAPFLQWPLLLVRLALPNTVQYCIMITHKCTNDTRLARLGCWLTANRPKTCTFFDASLSQFDISHLLVARFFGDDWLYVRHDPQKLTSLINQHASLICAISAQYRSSSAASNIRLFCALNPISWTQSHPRCTVCSYTKLYPYPVQ